MTVSNQTPITSATANGVTTVFPFGFYVAQASDLVVSFNGVAKTLNVDYTVSGTGNDAGGSITTTTTPPNGVVVDILRNTPLVREEDFQNAGDLPADELDRQFDRLWQALQDLNYAVETGVIGGNGESDYFAYQNNTIVGSGRSIAQGRNGMSAGPISILDGATVTIPTGSAWSIV